MTDLERIFEDCLRRVEDGELTPEECIGAHPEHAEELRRLFTARSELVRGRDLRPDPLMKARGRARLAQHMRANPRRRPGLLSRLFPAPLRPAGALAGLLLAFLVTGTALAQAALPGDPLYPWKRWSERAWLIASPNQAAAERLLLERRAQELIEVQGNSDFAAEARRRYVETVSEVSASEAGLGPDELGKLLAENQEQFQRNGITPPLSLPDPEPPLPEITPTPLPDLSTPPTPTAEDLDGAIPTEIPTLLPDLDG